MKKLIILVLLLSFVSCDNNKKETVAKLNSLIGTHFDYKDNRIIIEESQDFSSLVTSLTITLTSKEQNQILNNNASKFKYYETKVDSIMIKVFSYDVENENIKESINIIKDSNILNYTIYKY